MKRNQPTETYPEIEGLKSVRDCRLALRMGYNNLDSVKSEFQPELKLRLVAIENRARLLNSLEVR